MNSPQYFLQFGANDITAHSVSTENTTKSILTHAYQVLGKHMAIILHEGSNLITLCSKELLETQDESPLFMRFLEHEVSAFENEILCQTDFSKPKSPLGGLPTPHVNIKGFTNKELSLLFAESAVACRKIPAVSNFILSEKLSIKFGKYET